MGALPHPSPTMDVTCTRCDTVYEFEAGLIAPSGTTVKCTECGHLFKVYRPAPPHEPAGEPAARQRSWRVRTTDGTTHTLESLAELIRAIGTGQFAAEDEISRTGQVWKRLASIAELATLFDAQPRTRRRTDDPALAGSDATVEGRPRRRSTDHLLAPDRQPDEPANPRPRRPSPVLELGTPRRPASKPAPQTASDALASSAEPANAIDVARPPATGIEESPVVQTHAARRTLLSRNYLGLLSIAAALLITGSVAAVVFGASRAGVASNARVGALIEHGDRALASHRPEGFEIALNQYSEALRLFPNDPRLLTSISRAHAVWGQWLQQRVKDLDQASRGNSAEATELRILARQQANDAKRYAEQAVALDPQHGAPGVAWSDALRLSGDLSAAKAALERARSDGDAPPAETLRVAALLALDQAGGDGSAARALAEQAVAAEPSLLRARFLLLRCLIDAHSLDAARAQLRAVRQLDPNHPSIPALSAAIEAEAARLRGQRSTDTIPAGLRPPTQQPTGSLGTGRRAVTPA
jgi:predicted Zn finger-like uncharacterized protein